MNLIEELGLSLLQQIDPETAHGLTIGALKAGLGPKPSKDRDDRILATTVAGLKLPNCIGLAAGFDKHGEVPAQMARIGFGFVECGTVTPKPQPGNPRPRVFRLIKDQTVINRYGFNSVGLERFAANLSRRGKGAGVGDAVVGANIGANKETADRAADYVKGLKRLWPLADYFTVNISSPNTPGLRDLQVRGALDELLGRLAEARRSLDGQKPLFLKVAPDLGEPEIDDICASVLEHGLEAIIVGNTTLWRPEGLRPPHNLEAGGLSGVPLFPRSTSVLRHFHARVGGRIALIGCGGVGNGVDAYEKIRAGASAVQLYTMLSFHGPGLVQKIKRELIGCLRGDGFKTVAEAVGAG
jgi:dihydroorotate dehydrogenase